MGTRFRRAVQKLCERGAAAHQIVERRRLWNRSSGSPSGSSNTWAARAATFPRWKSPTPSSIPHHSIGEIATGAKVGRLRVDAHIFVCPRRPSLVRARICAWFH